MRFSFYSVLLIAVACVLSAAAYVRFAPRTASAPTAATVATTSPSASTTAEGSPNGPAASEGAPGTYTMAEVAVHASSESCWTVIHGSVYDLTTWIGQHPGGAGAIMRLCGSDGTAAFDAEHGGQSRPESMLKTFFVGPLAAS